MATTIYGSVAGFKAYFTEKGIAAAAATADATIAAKLVVASPWIDNRYRSVFPGLKVGQRAQEREWPRTGAYDYYGYPVASDSVPVEVEKATYEAAWREIVTPGSLSLDWTPGKYKSATVVGAVSVEYAQFGASSDVQTQFAIIDEILSGLIGGPYARDYSSLSGATGRA